jgi:hypothetical protein
MTNEHRQLVSLWVSMLLTAEWQVAPWNHDKWTQSRSLLMLANEQQNPLLVLQYLQRVRPILLAGRRWYIFMFPIRFIGRLLYIPILLLLEPFKLFGGLTLIAFIGLVIYHRTLYAQGTDLGWTYGHALFFAVLIALPLQGLVVILFGEYLALADYSSNRIPRMI